MTSPVLPLDYIGRSLRRLRDTARRDAENAISQRGREVKAAGVLHTNPYMLTIKEDLLSIFQKALVKMVRSAFDASQGSTDTPVTQLVKGEAKLLRQDLSDLVNASYSNLGAPQDAQRFLTDFNNRSQESADAAVEDFEHGMLEGTKLKPD